MKKIILLSATLLLTSQAMANFRMECKSVSAEVVFSAELYESMFVGKYTILNGVKSELAREGIFLESDTIEFYNQNRVFRVERARGPDTKFTLLSRLVGDELEVVEEGNCRRL